MGKKKSHKHVQHHKYELTKHQLSRLEKQRKRRRLFLIIGISVISVVGGVIGGGWYRDEYLPMHEPVVRVNDTECARRGSSRIFLSTCFRSSCTRSKMAMVLFKVRSSKNNGDWANLVSADRLTVLLPVDDGKA